MKILYSLPHPADQLADEQAGHTVRATAILAELERLGHEVVRVEAASDQTTQAAVNTYRSVVKKMIPRPVAMRMRDHARVASSRRFASRVIAAVEQHRPDAILETHIAFTLSGKIASAQTGVPLVMDDVAPSWEEAKTYGVGAGKLAVDVHREVTGQASLLVTVSHAIRRFLIEEGIPGDKVTVVSNGISSRFHPAVDGSAYRQQYGIPAEAVVLVFVGSFQPYHRVDLLLQAAAKAQTDQPVHLLLVGDGTRAPEAKAMSTRLGLDDRVTFTGRIPYDEVAGYAAAGDIAIMPATNTYGNPMKIYEYIALGKAVIAPDWDTITEIVTHGENAYLFEMENVDAMAAAIKTLVEDSALRDRLAAQAAQDAQQHTWAMRGQAMAAALEAMLAAAG